MINICILYSDNNKCIGKLDIDLSFLEKFKNADLIVIKPIDDNRIEMQVFSNNQCLADATLINDKWYKKFISAKGDVNTVKGACIAFFSEQAKKIQLFPIEIKPLNSDLPVAKENKDNSNVVNDFLRYTKSYYIPWYNSPRIDEGAKTPLLEETLEELGEPPKLTRELTVKILF